MTKHLPIVLIVTLAFFLRIYKISEFPPGLYSDETSYGYNAYSLLKTGKDEYGKSWPLTFKSFGDYKPPMTAWLTIPSIAIFGLNEFSVRFPSAIAGTITVLIIYLLVKELEFKTSSKIEEIASLLLAISPWHLHFSRSSMLVGIEALFISLGILLFLKSMKKPKLLYLSSLSFAAALYAYYGSRVTVGLIGIFLIFNLHRQLWKAKKHFIGALFVGMLALLPLAISFIRIPETLTGRARTISIFYDPGVRAKLWYSHSIDGENYPTFISRIFHNKVYYYGRDIARRYLQHFSYDFLVRTGDTTPPFDIPNMGIVYIVDLFFVLYGGVLIIKNRSPKKMILLSYLLVSPMVASLTFITPAANRSFNMIIPWTILVSLGITQFINNLNAHWKKTTSLILIIGYSGLFGYYLFQYYVRTPLDMPHKWHYGRQELVQKISAIENRYDHIVFSNHEGPAYIWLLFYKKYDPEKYLQTAAIDEQLDELGWLHVKSFDKYVFPRQFNWNTIEKDARTVYVGYEEEIPESEVKIIDKVLYPSGKTAFILATTK